MRRRTRNTAAAAATLACVLLVSGCAAEPAAPDRDVITIAIAEPSAPITPDHVDDPIVDRLLPAITAGLVVADPVGDVTLELAELIETEDQTRFVITLRGGLEFSDGTPVTPESFVRAWERRADPDAELPERSAFEDVLGFDDEEGRDLVAAGGLEILDDRSFAVTLAAPNPEFPRELARSAFLPLPAAAFDDLAAFEAHPVGAGPYMYLDASAWRPGDRLDLVPNPAYRGVREANNDGLSFRFFGDSRVALAELLSGDVDVVERLPGDAEDELGGLLADRIVEAPLPELESLVAPASAARFQGDEGRARRAALALAIDREVMSVEVRGGAAQPALGFLPTSFIVPPVDVPWTERANDEQARALWRDANDAVDWEGALTIAVVAGGADEELAEALAVRIRRVLSIEVVVARFDSAAGLDAAIAAEEITAFTLQSTLAPTGSIADALDRVVESVPTPQAFREQLDRAAQAETLETSMVAAMLAQSSLAEELPVIPIWSPTVRAGFGPDIHGVSHAWGGHLDYSKLTSQP